MTDISDFYKLNTLSVTLANSASNAATIYGNGNNQLPIVIDVEIVDDAGNAIPLSDAELQDMLRLCHYEDGGDINSGISLKYTSGRFDEPLLYSTLSSPATPRPDTVRTLRGYVSSAVTLESVLLAVQINIPGVGAFDTSRNGTTTINGPKGTTAGSVFKSPKSITLSVAEPINYSSSNRDNLKITNPITSYSADFREYVKDAQVDIEALPDVDDGRLGHLVNNAIIIEAGKEKHKFVEKEYRGERSPGWGSGAYSRYPAGVSGHTDNYCDYMFWHNLNDMDFCMLFIDASKYGVSHGTKFRSRGATNNKVYTLLVGSGDHRFDGDHDSRGDYRGIMDVSEDTIHVGYFVARIKRDSLRPDAKGEETTPTIPSVFVTDNYGNSGSIIITPLTDNKFPRVLINNLDSADYS